MTRTIMHSRTFSPRAFAALGVDSFAYVKPVRAGDRMVFEMYGADGTHLGESDDRRTADALLRTHDLEPVSVH